MGWAIFHGVCELTKSGGWAFDLQGFYFFAAVAIALLGVGKLSIAGEDGKLTRRWRDRPAIHCLEWIPKVIGSPISEVAANHGGESDIDCRRSRVI